MYTPCRSHIALHMGDHAFILAKLLGCFMPRLEFSKASTLSSAEKDALRYLSCQVLQQRIMIIHHNLSFQKNIYNSLNGHTWQNIGINRQIITLSIFRNCLWMIALNHDKLPSNSSGTRPQGSPIGCAHGAHLFLIGIHGARLRPRGHTSDWPDVNLIEPVEVE